MHASNYIHFGRSNHLLVLRLVATTSHFQVKNTSMVLIIGLRFGLYVFPTTVVKMPFQRHRPIHCNMLLS